MAKVNIFKLEFLVNSGSAVVGDVLDIFIETTLIVTPAYPLSFETTGITVELNGVSLPVDNGYYWGFLSPGDYTLQSFNQNICSGTSLITFSSGWALWPYATYYSQENHYSCAVNPPTCDLMVNGIPTVTPATDSVTPDGSIEITATSTNTIEYKLGSDFVYGDGTGQLSNIFSALLPGDYRIFLRDSANCQANVLVNIGVNNVHAAKYVLEYTDQNNWGTKIEITRRGYTGDPLYEVCAEYAEPFSAQLRGEGDVDKFISLLGITAVFNPISETNFQFIELFTNDPNLYRLRYWKNFGSGYELKLTTKVIKQQYQEPYKHHPYVVSFKASDGLAELKEYYLIQRDGQKYAGTISLVKLIAYCLSVIKLDLNINIGINMFAYGMDNGIDARVLSLADFETRSVGANIDWTEGVNPTVSVTLQTSEILFLDFAFMPGYEYVITLNYDFSASGTSSVSLSVLDDSFGVVDGTNQIVSTSGTQDIILTTTATTSSKKIGVVVSGSVNVTLNSISILKTVADPLDQSEVDFELFYINNNEPTLDYVLSACIEPFGARIIQWDNAWWVVRIEEMAQPYDYRTFDKDGVYVSNGTFSPVMDLDFPTNDGDLQLKRDPHLEVIPSYGTLKVIYHLGLRPNLFKNGDFRLKTVPIPGSSAFILDINKEGFTLVNAGYSISEGFSILNEGVKTVAYNLTSYINDALDSGNGGEAYIQSEALDVRMGTNNTLRINFRYKISSSYTYINFLILQYFKVKVPYVKVRALITFEVGVDTYYLTADGRWSEEVNEVLFFVDKFDEFVESEVSAVQPPSGATGGDFKVRFYIPFAYYAQFTTVTDLRAFETVDSGDAIIPNGYRTEWREAYAVGPATLYNMHYYVLEENTDAEAVPTIVRPDDYHATLNPRQWIKKDYANSGDTAISNPKLTFTLSLDRIRVTYLTDGEDPMDTITRTVPGEASNNSILEKELIMGSYSTLIVTNIDFSIDLGVFFKGSGGGISTTATNILSAYLIYTGYLRDSAGAGWDAWSRDGISESDSIHGILLKSLAAQYKQSSRLLRGTFISKNYFGFLNIVREVNDNNRLYLPMGLSLNDKRCEYTGSMIELKNIYADPGSDGSSESPYNSAFSTGFGADFN